MKYILETGDYLVLVQLLLLTLRFSGINLYCLLLGGKLDSDCLTGDAFGWVSRCGEPHGAYNYGGDAEDKKLLFVFLAIVDSDGRVDTTLLLGSWIDYLRSILDIGVSLDLWGDMIVREFFSVLLDYLLIECDLFFEEVIFSLEFGIFDHQFLICSFRHLKLFL